MDLSLDDIIQKRNIRVPFKGRGGNNRARQQGRGNALNRTGNTNPNKKFASNRNSGEGVFSGRLNSGRIGGGRVNNTGRTITDRVNTGRVGKINQARPITDARQKIIQKNRLKMTDAREKLGELAKQTDARLKLEKLRVNRQTGRIPLSVGNPRQPVGNPRQPMGNPRQPMGNPRQPMGNPRQPVGNPRQPVQRNHDQQQRKNLQVPLQRTIRQTVPNNWYRHSVDDVDVDMDMDIDTPLTGVSQVLRRTIPNEQATSRQFHRPSSFSSWPTSQHRPQKEAQSVPRGYDGNYSGKTMRLGQTNITLTGRIRSGDYSDLPSRSSLALLKPRNPGYRIVISNLHAAVIHEDIQELFEDVGPLLESRLVRPGTAEVVFKQLKDAERAVEVYHNRQLDGQPMKCMLVNAQQVGSTTPPSHSNTRAMGSTLRVGVKVGSGSKSAVVPDISTIHKALFNRS